MTPGRLQKSLARHVFVYGLSTMLTRGAVVASLILLPLILTPTAYGALGLITTFGALVMVAVPMEISQGLARYFTTAPPDQRMMYARTAWWFTVIALGVFAIFGEAYATYASNWLMGSIVYHNVVRLGIAVITVNTLFYFVQSQFRWEFRTRDFALVSTVYALGTLGLSVGLGLMFTPALDGVLLGQLLGGGIAVALAAWKLRASLAPGLDRAKLRQMLAYSLPLAPASIALFFSVYASRLILNDQASLAEVGLFTYASQIANLVTIVLLGVQAALTPLVMAHHAEPETPSAIARLFESFVGLALIACLALGLLVPDVLMLLGKSAYRDAGRLVLLLAPAYLLYQIYIFAPGFAIAKRTGLQLVVSLAGAVLCVGANYLLVPRYGIAGAAIATLAAAVGFIALWFILSQRLYPVPIRWTRLMIFVAITSVVAAAGSTVAAAGTLRGIVLRGSMVLAMFPVVIASELLPRSYLMRLRRRDGRRA